jgi:molybdopterin synthase catalytic subunit
VSTSVRVQESDFSLAEEWTAMRKRIGGEAGAIVAFAGLVRDQADLGKSVSTLFIEHYPGMTESSMQKIVDKAISRWPIYDVVVVHRIGKLLPNDQIVLVLVASQHRGAAFEACEFIMDFMKTKAVFWKKETQNDGSASVEEWVHSRAMDHWRTEHWNKSSSNS